jgi:predicted dithiol-disulfide oxidoreductase (DUF899 family)
MTLFLMISIHRLILSFCASFIVHLNQRDVTMIAVSRAPYSKLAAYQKRMGWDFKWFSSYNTDFNFDFNVSFTREELAKNKVFYNYIAEPHGQSPFNPPGAEREGVSVFFKDPGARVFHTYSAYARGIDMLNVAYHYLDLVPKGRDEVGHDFVNSGSAAMMNTTVKGFDRILD